MVHIALEFLLIFILQLIKCSRVQFAKSNRIIPFKNPPSKVELPSAGKLMKDISKRKMKNKNAICYSEEKDFKLFL